MGRRVFSERCSRMSWVPAIRRLCSGIFSTINMRMRTHQYTISASSPRSSVPAATVRPSTDTSQERSALCAPSYGTVGRHRSVFSQCLKNVSCPAPLRYGTVRKFHFTYSRSRWYPCGHPIHARRHPFQRKRSLFYLCRQ